MTILLEGQPQILPEEGRLEFKKKEAKENADAQPESREHPAEETEPVPAGFHPNYWQSAENYLVSEAQKGTSPRPPKP